jgi:hypothetical protein
MHRLSPPHTGRHGRRRVRVAAALLVSVAVAAAPGASGAQQRGSPPASGPAAAGPAPSRTLSPEDVVSIQLEALHHNDSPSRDAGIETTFRFASPANRVATGPLDRFADLVKASAYRAMIDYRRVERGPMRVDGDEARQRVVVYSAAGVRVSYMFLLSRQHGGAYDGCWMTDGVVRIDDTGPRPDGLRSA